MTKLMSLATNRNVMIWTARFSIGLFQGLLLWGLREARRGQFQPLADEPLFVAALTAALVVPVLAIVSLGNLRPRTLLFWLLGAFAACTGFGFHAGFRQAPLATGSGFDMVVFAVVVAGVFFVGHTLVAAADADRRWIARFPTCFELAWNLALQAAFAVLFVGLFWGILLLGTSLFGAIGIAKPAEIMTREWFRYPATAVAAAISLHLTDAGGPLIRGVRDLLLRVLSWLTPVLVMVGLAFLVALLFVGLGPLWETRQATPSLLAAGLLLVVLINAHFRDGSSADGGAGLLAYVRLAAVLMLTPFTALAAIGLGMRIEQHGWTPPRVAGFAILIVVVCHALGYLAAVVRSGVALRGLPMTNTISAFVAIAVAVALLTPVADPARLSVNDQIGRLKAGRVDPAAFDYRLLRFETGRYGVSALQRLRDRQEGTLPAEVARRAAEALSLDYSRWGAAGDWWRRAFIVSQKGPAPVLASLSLDGGSGHPGGS